MDWFTGPHMDRHFFVLAVVFYGLSTLYSVFLWRKGFREDDRVNYMLLLGAFLFHTTSMLTRGIQLKQCPVSNLYEATMFVAWTIVTIYLIVGLWPRLRFLGAFASPILFGGGLFSLMRALDPPHNVHTESHQVWLSLHVALASLAYGAFGLSCAAALMYLTQERNLKFHRLKAIFSLMPPIQRLEVIVSRLMVCGLGLWTLGLAIGALGLTKVDNAHAFRGDPKIIWSALVWLLYLGLVIMRWRFAQGGRRFALGAIGSFVFIALTFWGVSLLSPLHNQ